MKWNPYLNALVASAYIFLVVIGIHFIELKRHDTPDTLIDGVGAISLFVFSAAIMAFLFFYQPVLKLLENRQSEAVSYFLKTLLAFGVITFAVLAFVSLQ